MIVGIVVFLCILIKVLAGVSVEVRGVEVPDELYDTSRKFPAWIGLVAAAGVAAGAVQGDGGLDQVPGAVELVAPGQLDEPLAGEVHLEPGVEVAVVGLRGLEHLGRDGQELLELRLALLSHQRSTVIRLRDEGRIDDAVLRQLQARLDLEEIRLSGGPVVE